MSYKTRKFAGFTLIELLVTIVIIGILATISVATFQGYFEKARLAKAQQFASAAETKLKADTLSNSLTVLADCPLDRLNGNKIDCLGGYSLGKWRYGAEITAVNLKDDTHNENGKSLNNIAVVSDSFRAKLMDGVTISAWMKIDNGSEWNHGSVSFFQSQSNENGFTADLDFSMYNRDNNKSVGTFILNYNPTPPVKQYTLAGPLLDIDDDKWHHLLGTYNDSDKIAKFYFDGELVAIKHTPDTSNFPSSSFNAFSWARSEGSDLYVDDFIFYPIEIKGIIPRSGNKTRTLADGGDEFDLS